MEVPDRIIPQRQGVEKEHHDPWANEVQCQTIVPSKGLRPLSAIEKEMPPELMARAVLENDQSALRDFFAPLSPHDREKGLIDIVNASVQNFVTEQNSPERGLLQMSWNETDNALTVNQITPHERPLGVFSEKWPPTEKYTSVLEIPFGTTNAEK